MAKKQREWPVYWAYGVYYKSEKERPWLEFVSTPDGAQCYPITHEKPIRDAWRYFYLDPKDVGFPKATLDLPSWIDVTYSVAIPKGAALRREGVIGGDLAMRFDFFLASRVGGKPRGVNPPRPIFDGEEVFIGPWFYGRRSSGFQPMERAAIDAYGAAIVDKSLPERVCYYSQDGERIIRGADIPGVTFWIRAYVDLWWNRAWTKDDRDEWKRIIARRKNAIVVERMRATYYGNVHRWHELDFLTPDQRVGAILAESATWRFRYPTDVDSADMSAYVDEYCWPLIFTKGGGW